MAWHTVGAEEHEEEMGLLAEFVSHDAGPLLAYTNCCFVLYKIVVLCVKFMPQKGLSLAKNVLKHVGSRLGGLVHGDDDLDMRNRGRVRREKSPNTRLWKFKAEQIIQLHMIHVVACSCRLHSTNNCN